MTPDDSTPKYKRRRVLRMAGLVAGASVQPAACRAVSSPSQEVDATVVQSATPTATTHPVASSTPQNVSTDRVAVDVVALGILRSLGTTKAGSAGSVWNLEQIQRSVQLGMGVGSAAQIELVTADSGSQKMADLIRKRIVA